MKIVSSAPHFFVSDVTRSVRFYVDVLGFEEPPMWGEPPCFAMPSRDGYIIMLNQSDTHQPAPNGRQGEWDAYFWVDKIGDFHEQVHQRGADIVHGPEKRPYYGMIELGIRDPDGYMLVFAEDLPESDTNLSDE